MPENTHDIVLDRPDLAGVDNMLEKEAKELRDEVSESIKDPEDALLSTRTKATAKSLAGLKKEMGDRGEAYLTSVKSFEATMGKFKPSGEANDAATKVYRDLELGNDGAARVDVIYDEAYRRALGEICSFADEYTDQVEGNEKLAFAMHYYVSAMSRQEPFEQPNFKNDFIRMAMDTEGGPGMTKEEATSLRDALIEVSAGYPVPFNKFVEDNEFNANTTAEEDRETARNAQTLRHEKWGKLIDVFDSFVDEEPRLGKWEKLRELEGSENMAIGENPWANWEQKHQAAGGKVIDLTGGNVAEGHDTMFSGTKYRAFKSSSYIRLENTEEIVEHNGVQYIKKVQKAVTTYNTGGIKDVRGHKQAYSKKVNGMTHEGRGLISEYERLQQLSSAKESNGAFMVPGLNDEGEMVAHKMDADTYWRSVRVLTAAVKSHELPPPPGGQKYEVLKREELANAQAEGRSTRRKQFVTELAGGDFTSLRAEREVNKNFNEQLTALEAETPQNEHLVKMMRESQNALLSEYQSLDVNYGRGNKYTEIAEQQLLLKKEAGLNNLDAGTDAWKAAVDKEQEEVAKAFFYKKIILNETAVEMRRYMAMYKNDPDKLNTYLVNLDHRVAALVSERSMTEDLNSSDPRQAEKIQQIRHQIQQSMFGVLRNTQSFEGEHADNTARSERIRKEHLTSMAELRSYLEVTGIAPRAWADVASRYEILGEEGSAQDTARFLSVEDYVETPEQILTSKLSLVLDILEDYDENTGLGLKSLEMVAANNVQSREMSALEKKDFVEVFGRTPTNQELASFRYNESRFNSRAQVAMVAGRVAEVDRIFDFINAKDDAGEELNADILFDNIKNRLDTKRGALLTERELAQEVREQESRELMTSAERYAQGKAKLVELQNRRAERGDLIAADLDGLSGDELAQKEAMFAEATSIRFDRQRSIDGAEATAAQTAIENEAAAEEVATTITPQRLDTIQERFQDILTDGSKRSRWLLKDVQADVSVQVSEIMQTVEQLRQGGGDASPEDAGKYVALWGISKELTDLLSEADALVSQGRTGRASANALRATVRTRLTDLPNEVAASEREIPRNLYENETRDGVPNIVIAAAYRELRAGSAEAPSNEQVMSYARYLNGLGSIEDFAVQPEQEPEKPTISSLI